MFGSVAPSYSMWAKDGQPYKKGKYYYIAVINPATKLKKEVRWYTTKAATSTSAIKEPPYKIFGFKSADDTILMIKEYNISKQELENFFYHKWRYVDIYGGVWYASKDTPIPPIKNGNKVFECDWANFQKENLARCRALGLEGKFWKM